MIKLVGCEFRLIGGSSDRLGRLKVSQSRVLVWRLFVAVSRRSVADKTAYLSYLITLYLC